MFVVTIKLPRGWNGPHDPHRKVEGKCPFSNSCTDSTGEHHSTAVDTWAEVEAIQEQFTHITRIEDL